MAIQDGDLELVHETLVKFRARTPDAEVTPDSLQQSITETLQNQLIPLVNMGRARNNQEPLEINFQDGISSEEFRQISALIDEQKETPFYKQNNFDAVIPAMGRIMGVNLAAEPAVVEPVAAEPATAELAVEPDAAEPAGDTQDPLPDLPAEAEQVSEAPLDDSESQSAPAESSQVTFSADNPPLPMVAIPIVQTALNKVAAVIFEQKNAADGKEPEGIEGMFSALFVPNVVGAGAPDSGNLNNESLQTNLWLMRIKLGLKKSLFEGDQLGLYHPRVGEEIRTKLLGMEHSPDGDEREIFKEFGGAAGIENLIVSLDVLYDSRDIKRELLIDSPFEDPGFMGQMMKGVLDWLKGTGILGVISGLLANFGIDLKSMPGIGDLLGGDEAETRTAAADPAPSPGAQPGPPGEPVSSATRGSTLDRPAFDSDTLPEMNVHFAHVAPIGFDAGLSPELVADQPTDRLAMIKDNGRDIVGTIGPETNDPTVKPGPSPIQAA